MTLTLVYTLWFLGAVVIGIACYGPTAERIADYTRRRATEASTQLNDIFVNFSQRTIWMAYAGAPLAAGLVAWFLTGRIIVAGVGLLFGFVLPRIVVSHMRRSHQKRFHNQLVDGLLLLSSSLKAGLSMTQAFTVLVEEMPAPISQEFGLLLKESRMGVNLDEAMLHLRDRIPGDDVSLFVTAVLVARETGGDITHVFTKLVETLRERKKLKERIKTLTFMARFQGFIMAMLPFAFGYLVYNMNPHYFEFFIMNPTGRSMLVMIVLMQIVGGVLFMRFSRSPIPEH
jgi:tight adherence protein B